MGIGLLVRLRKFSNLDLNAVRNNGPFVAGCFLAERPKDFFLNREVNNSFVLLRFQVVPLKSVLPSFFSRAVNN